MSPRRAGSASRGRRRSAPTMAAGRWPSTARSSTPSASRGSSRIAGGRSGRCAGATGRSSPRAGATSSSSATSSRAGGTASADRRAQRTSTRRNSAVSAENIRLGVGGCVHCLPTASTHGTSDLGPPVYQRALHPLVRDALLRRHRHLAPAIAVNRTGPSPAMTYRAADAADISRAPAPRGLRPRRRRSACLHAAARARAASVPAGVAARSASSSSSPCCSRSWRHARRASRSPPRGRSCRARSSRASRRRCGSRRSC